MSRYAALFSIMLAPAILTGCGSSPKANHYTLSPGGGAVQQANASSAKVSIGITAVSLPEVVDRPQMVLRQGANEIVLEELHRWAEPLKREIPRVIAEHLSRRLEHVRVAAHPQSAALDSDYRLTLDFQRFEARLGRETVLDVLWTIRAADRSIGKSGRISLSEPVSGNTHDALVAAYGRALERASSAIARDLEGLASPKR